MHYSSEQRCTEFNPFFGVRLPASSSILTNESGRIMQIVFNSDRGKIVISVARLI